MRTFIAALVGVVLLSASNYNPEGRRPPTVLLETAMLGEVRRASEIATAADLRRPGDVLVVKRPVDAREFGDAGVFVVSAEGVARRAWVVFGRASAPLIQVESGLSAGERIIVGDMRAWDAFDRLLVRVR
jgi:hypothetical protein